jgi:predicted AAA+ superfamily ATPase
MDFMERYITKYIKQDLEKKLVLLSGPRQVGKTTLSKSLYPQFEYFNWDTIEDRPIMDEKSWDRKKPLVIFDEIHKKPKFKSWLKGIYDKEGVRPRILVTGSSRLDIAKKMGDSLAGRFFGFRLYPLDLWEISSKDSLEKIYNRLLKRGGFPEPYFAKEDEYYKRWATTHLDLILRQDLLDLENVRNISKIETLIALLQLRVGSSVSYASLAKNLEVDAKTVKQWLTILENFFVIFRVTPFHENIAKSILKEPKYYFFDIARIRGDESAKFENLVALSIKKQIDFLHDTRGIKGNLFYLRTKGGAEIDFFVQLEGYSGLMIECKLSDENRSPHFTHFSRFIKNHKAVQLVKNLTREKTYPDHLEIRSALPWLKNIDLLS